MASEATHLLAGASNQEQDNIMASRDPIREVKEYKGSSFPSPIVPLSGLALAIAILFAVYHMIPKSYEGLEVSEVFLRLGESMILFGILFLSEFFLGAAARSESPEASFSPAAALAAGLAPFGVIRANRIHQNHIESLLIYLPAVVSAAAAGANGRLLVATTITWFLGRIVYRIGYCNDAMPFWRICGVVMSLTQSFICMGVFARAKLGR